MVGRLVAVLGVPTVQRGAPEKMCIAAKPGYRGCELVNRLEKARQQA